MAELNLNFHKNTSYYNPTKEEIAEIESVARSVKSIIKALGAYAKGDYEDIGSVCSDVCGTLELLIDPVIDYLFEYAGGVPAPEETEGETA